MASSGMLVLLRRYVQDYMKLNITLGFSSECDQEAREFCLRHQNCHLAAVAAVEALVVVVVAALAAAAVIVVVPAAHMRLTRKALFLSLPS